jgi:3-isopropylmalate dehydrogenase
MTAHIALIKGDGIGGDICDATLYLVNLALRQVGAAPLSVTPIDAGAAYFQDTGLDIEPHGEETAGACDAIFLGAIGLPSIRHPDGTEISPHLRLRERFQLYAGVRPVKAYPHIPQKLADPRAASIDFIVIRESTEGLFHTAAVHNRSHIEPDIAVEETMRITRKTTEKLHRFAFNLARKRRAAGKAGCVTCVDKANVFTAMAFFRKIFDEISTLYPDVDTAYNYVDAQALDLIRQPWNADILVMENMFGDILSDLAGGLVGGMGMAACAEIGDETGLFQPAHGSAPDIMGMDRANPMAAILSGVMMLDYLADKLDLPAYGDASRLLDHAITAAFENNNVRPMEFGGDMGTRTVTKAIAESCQNLPAGL